MAYMFAVNPFRSTHLHLQRRFYGQDSVVHAYLGPRVSRHSFFLTTSSMACGSVTAAALLTGESNTMGLC